MGLEYNVSIVKSYLKRLGWYLNNEDELFEYYKCSEWELRYPKLKKDLGYGKLLEIYIKRAGEVSPDIRKLPVYGTLLSQLQNYKQKYSKDKNEWILSEPNSKYRFSEIPLVYVPQNTIFEI